MNSPSTFVMVPGAWHGGWAWHPVAHRLKAAGHRAIAVTPPGMQLGDDPAGLTLSDAVDHLVQVIVKRDLTNISLVAHSWGGYPVTGAAHQVPDRIAKVTYFSAVVPMAGVSMTDELPDPGAEFTRAAIDAATDGAVGLPFEVFAQSLMQGEPEAHQRLVFDLLVPQPGRYLIESLRVDDVTKELGIPTAYVLAQDDHALARPGSEFAARLGLEPQVVPGTHEALLTHPTEVAHALLGP